MSKILSFDISSTTTAWAVLEIVDSQIIFIKSNYIKPSKKGSIIERLSDTRDKIKEIIEKEDPDYIGIEDIIQFIKGKSSANTVITLSVFNRMICLLANDFLQNKNKTSPELFSVLSIRHALKLTKVLPKKEDMSELVAHHLNINFPYEKNRKGNLKVENGDLADSIAVGLYYAFKLTNKIKSKKKK